MSTMTDDLEEVLQYAGLQPSNAEETAKTIGKLIESIVAREVASAINNHISAYHWKDA
jgi:dihydroneopterin aldolase